MSPRPPRAVDPAPPSRRTYRTRAVVGLRNHGVTITGHGLDEIVDRPGAAIVPAVPWRSDSFGDSCASSHACNRDRTHTRRARPRCGSRGGTARSTRPDSTRSPSRRLVARSAGRHDEPARRTRSSNPPGSCGAGPTPPVGTACPALRRSTCRARRPRPRSTPPTRRARRSRRGCTGCGVESNVAARTTPSSTVARNVPSANWTTACSCRHAYVLRLMPRQIRTHTTRVRIRLFGCPRTGAWTHSPASSRPASTAGPAAAARRSSATRGRTPLRPRPRPRASGPACGAGPTASRPPDGSTRPSSCAARCGPSRTARSTTPPRTPSPPRLGVSARHLRRLFDVHVGATPAEVARSRRAHFARRLLDDTDLSARPGRHRGRASTASASSTG